MIQNPKSIIQNRKRLFLLVALPLLLVGCGIARHGRGSVASGPELTPAQFGLLSDADKVRYRNIVIRIPESLGGGTLLPFDSGPYRSPLEKSIHTGDTRTLMGLYNQSMFELENPRIKVEPLNFDMWSSNFNSALAVALAAGHAPAFYVARDLPHTIYQGMYADLTPLMKTWDQFKNQPEGTVREGTVDGHMYTVAGPELSALIIRYRKDWFREAGIFNEKGEPGPPAHWTWEDFRKIAKKITDPKRGRYGFAGQMNDFLYNNAHDLDLTIPDPTKRRTWIFNDRDPKLIQSLQAARAMFNQDKSVDTSVAMDWYQWHGEFDAGHAGMIISWAAHIPRESLESPEKFGKDHPYTQTVGMAVPPHDGLEPGVLRPTTNPIGFDPTLKPDELKAAFEWCKSYFYGDMFVNRMRDATTSARILGRRSTLYAEMLAMPYKPPVNLLAVPYSKVFPAEYLNVYQQIRDAHTPPLPREFGLQEPADNEFQGAINAMYQEALTSNVDLKALVAKTAHLINTTLLDFRGKDDDIRLHRYIEARSEFYRVHFPTYYRTGWQEKLRRYYNVS